MESLLKTLWRRLRFYLIDWGIIARRGIFYIGGSDTLPPPLEREKEAELIARMDEGDESVRGTLIEHNLRLVAYIARRFENTGINIEDLISIGTIGLIKAVNTYRSDKNIKLATYASRCIENEILMHLRKTAPQKSEVSFDGRQAHRKGENNHHAALWPRWTGGKDAEGGRRPDGHFAELYLAA